MSMVTVSTNERRTMAGITKTVHGLCGSPALPHTRGKHALKAFMHESESGDKR